MVVPGCGEDQDTVRVNGTRGTVDMVINEKNTLEGG
jgi:hypothetical protein